MKNDNLTDELTNVDADGVPVQMRLPSPRALRQMYEDFVRADIDAARIRASIMGLVNGAPPYSDKKLKDDGASFRRNFNPRDAESIMDSLCTADFNLAFDVRHAINVKFTPGFMTDPYVARSYGNKIAQAYSHVFKNEARVVEASQRAIRDKNELGLGFFFRPNRFDWRPKGVMRGRVFFNPSASSDCSDIGEITVIDTKTIEELFELISKPEVSKKAGWHIDNLKEALAGFYYNEGKVKDSFGGDYMLAWEDLERRYRAYDTGIISRQHETFPIVHGFVKERTGKVSQYIIPQVSPKFPEKYLFESFEVVDSMDEVTTPFPFDFGEGTLASVKGSGHRIYALCVEAAKSLMRTMDTVDLASSLIAHNATGGELAFSMHRFGPVTLLDKGIQPVQTSFSPPIQPSMAAREMLLRVLSNNTGAFRAQMEDTSQRESIKTAEQIRYEGNREATYEKYRLFQTYLHWDKLHQVTFARLLDPKCRSSAAPKKARESAQLFWDMCLALGVPEELLTDYKEHILVTATRSIGSGSTYAKLNNLNTARNTGLTNSMTERGRRELDIEIFSALAGYDAIDVHFEDSDSSETPSNASSHANLEVNDFYEGTPCLVGVDQNQVAHLNVHLAAMVQEAEMFQKDPMSMDLERTVNLFQQGLPHAMRHVQILETDPTREKQVAEYKQTIEQLSMFLQQIAPMFEEIQKAKAQEIEQLRQQNQQLLQSQDKVQLEHQRALMKMQGDLEIERMKTENLNQSRIDKTEAAIQTKINSAGQALAIKQAQFQQEMNERMTKLNLLIQETQAKIASKGE